jgi:hypothetical protein
MTWLSIIGWLALFAALLLIGVTRPEATSFLGFNVETYMRKIWDVDLQLYSLYLNITALLFGCIGLIMNTTRRRRRHDFFRGSLILLAILSGLGIAWYLYLFLSK